MLLNTRLMSAFGVFIMIGGSVAQADLIEIAINTPVTVTNGVISATSALGFIKNGNGSAGNGSAVALVNDAATVTITQTSAAVAISGGTEAATFNLTITDISVGGLYSGAKFTSAVTGTLAVPGNNLLNTGLNLVFSGVLVGPPYASTGGLVVPIDPSTTTVGISFTGGHTGTANGQFFSSGKGSTGTTTITAPTPTTGSSVPEPSTFVLLGLGAIGLLAKSVRRRVVAA